MSAEQAPHADAADEALDLWLRSDAARRELAHERAAEVRRRRLRAVVTLGTLVVAGFAAGRASAAPPPDPAPPLAYSRAQVARAAYGWSEDVLATPDADGVTWQPWSASCSSRRRCRIDGVWWVDDTYTVATYRLRACRPSRRVWEDDLAKTQRGWVARVLIDRRGGVVCRVPDPPYVPAEARHA